LRGHKATYRGRNTVSDVLLDKNSRKINKQQMNLQHVLFANFSGITSLAELGAVPKKIFVIKFFLGNYTICKKLLRKKISFEESVI